MIEYREWAEAPDENERGKIRLPEQDPLDLLSQTYFEARSPAYRYDICPEPKERDYIYHALRIDSFITTSFKSFHLNDDILSFEIEPTVYSMEALLAHLDDVSSEYPSTLLAVSPLFMQSVSLGRFDHSTPISVAMPLNISTLPQGNRAEMQTGLEAQNLQFADRSMSLLALKLIHLIRGRVVFDSGEELHNGLHLRDSIGIICNHNDQIVSNDCFPVPGPNWEANYSFQKLRALAQKCSISS
mgnify:CR=1 FL=1